MYIFLGILKLIFFLEKSAFVDFFSVNENRCFFEKKKKLGALNHLLHGEVRSSLRHKWRFCFLAGALK